ncbi:UNVERIFIED_CONTAM: hypothetical protein FKN15_056888 [Acipenser sinensis]
MDVSVSVSFFQDELASTIEHAVKAAVDTVLCEITKVVGGKFTEFQMEMAGKEKENESLKLRLEISESELKAVRECMNAADADIKQPLRNMNPDCNEQDFQRNENQGLFQGYKDSRNQRYGSVEIWRKTEKNDPRIQNPGSRKQAQPIATTPALGSGEHTLSSKVCAVSHSLLYTLQTHHVSHKEDNAALGSLQASLQAPGQTTGVAGSR